MGERPAAASRAASSFSAAAAAAAISLFFFAMDSSMVARGASSGERASASLGVDVSSSGSKGDGVKRYLVADDGVWWLPGCLRCPAGDLEALRVSSSNFSSGEFEVNLGKRSLGGESVCCTLASIELLCSQLIRLNDTYYT